MFLEVFKRFLICWWNHESSCFFGMRWITTMEVEKEPLGIILRKRKGSKRKKNNNKINIENLCKNAHGARCSIAFQVQCLMAFKGPIDFFLLIIRPIHRSGWSTLTCHPFSSSSFLQFGRLWPWMMEVVQESYLYSILSLVFFYLSLVVSSHIFYWYLPKASYSGVWKGFLCIIFTFMEIHIGPSSQLNLTQVRKR